ncbi:MAG: hypothetical protein K0R83_107 [Caulobacter sp.]|nr:hypothetical protein [Caulobacter sp.]
MSSSDPGRRIFFGASSGSDVVCTARCGAGATGGGAATGAAGAPARPRAASKKAFCAAVRAGEVVGAAGGCQLVGRMSAMAEGFGGYG